MKTPDQMIAARLSAATKDRDPEAFGAAFTEALNAQVAASKMQGIREEMETLQPPPTLRKRTVKPLVYAVRLGVAMQISDATDQPLV